MNHVGNPVHTTLGKGCEITGKLTFDGTVEIDGHVEGEIIAQETVLIGDTAVVKAQIMADSVVITGTVTGDIIANRRLEIRAPARVHGNISTPSLIVHDGVVFEGRCSMANAPAPKKDTNGVVAAKKSKGADEAEGKVQEGEVLPPSKTWTNWKETRG